MVEYGIHFVPGKVLWPQDHDSHKPKRAGPVDMLWHMEHGHIIYYKKQNTVEGKEGVVIIL